MSLKVVILAGGRGTRISEETKNVPKPMIRVGDKPILHHIMDEYISQGVNEFVVLAGYKSEIIYGYFLGISDEMSQGGGSCTFKTSEWKVEVVSSGLEPMTGGRLKRAEPFVGDNFFFTYGDGVSNIDIHDVLETHLRYKAVATISGIRPSPRFGSVLFDSKGRVLDFGEKQEYLSGWINGGFAVLSSEIFSYIDSDECNLEKDVYPVLAKKNKMYVVTHEGFWHCVDTLRDVESLEEIYRDRGAIWTE